MATSPWYGRRRAGEGPATAIAAVMMIPRFRDVPAVFAWGRQVARQLRESDGLVGFSLKAHLLSRRFYNLSLWRDQEAMQRFVHQDPHRTAMASLQPRMSGGSYVIWTIPERSPRPRWREARVRLRRPDAAVGVLSPASATP